MSKSYCFAVVLAVICLSIMLLSFEADAQPTVDETWSCGSSTLEEVARDVKDMKRLLVANPVDGVTTDPSKRVLVSALTSKNLTDIFVIDLAQNNDTLPIWHIQHNTVLRNIPTY